MTSLVLHDFPADLRRRLKVTAASRGITLKAFIIEALEEKCGKTASAIPPPPVGLYESQPVPTPSPGANGKVRPQQMEEMAALDDRDQHAPGGEETDT